VFFPAVLKTLPLLMIEKSNIGQQSGGLQHVTHEASHIVFEFGARLLPSVRLT
jgi:hypothetical protein